MDSEERSPVLLLRNDPRTLHPSMELYTTEYQDSIRRVRGSDIRAGSHEPLHNLCPRGLPAPAPGGEAR